MTTTTVVKEKTKEDKVNLQNEMSSLKQSMADFRAERKLKWKAFKSKFIGDIDKIEKSIKKLTSLHKK